MNSPSKDKKQNSDVFKTNSESSNSKFLTIANRLKLIKSILEDTSGDVKLLLDSNATPNDILKHSEHDCSQNSKCTDSKCILGKKRVGNIASVFISSIVLNYVKSGTSGHTFKGSVKNIDGEIVNFAMKVVAYPINEKYGNIFDIRRPENAELAIAKVLGTIVTTGQTPHIILPIHTFNMKLSNFIKLTEDRIKKKKKGKKYMEFIIRCKKNEFNPIISVLIGEWANGGDLLDYLNNNYKTMKLIDWKVLFFQVISTLAIIQETFPAYRHNDLKPNNILMSLMEVKKGKFNKYKIKEQNFIVYNRGFMIRICDFDFACIPGVVENAKVSAKWSDEINVKPIQNRYYDVHYFFNMLTSECFFPKILTSKRIPIEVREFIRKIVPEKYASGKNVAERGRILTNIEYVLPIDIIIKDDFFAEFRYSAKQMDELYDRIARKKK
jgi:hypothetical protein